MLPGKFPGRENLPVTGDNLAKKKGGGNPLNTMVIIHQTTEKENTIILSRDPDQQALSWQHTGPDLSHCLHRAFA